MKLMASTLSIFKFSPMFSAKMQPISYFEKRRFSFTCFLSKKKKLGFFDEILDYIEGGPKLRKWYGAPDPMDKDVNALDEDETSEEGEIRDAVLVTDGDNEIGQLVLLSLVVKRIRVKAVVKDKRAATEAFGTYVEAISGDVKNKVFMRKAFRGVRAVICTTEGFPSIVDDWGGIQHVILLSQLYAYRSYTGIQAAMASNARKLAEVDEDAVKASGVPYTIIRTGKLVSIPIGEQGFSFREGSAGKGCLSKEAAAFICVEALDHVPKRELIFEVVNDEFEMVDDWKSCFAALLERQAELK